MAGLYVWVEGDDDRRFFDQVFRPTLILYDYISVQPYACMKVSKVRAYFRSIDAMDAEAVLFGDLDDCQSPDERASILRATYGVPDRFPVIVVCRVIEGWYLAGLIELGDRKMWIGDVGVNVNNLEKESFNAGKPRRFVSRIDWMVELLKVHDRGHAARRSPSFRAASLLLRP